MHFDKRLARACAIPAVISIAALAFGAVVGVATSPATNDIHVAYAQEATPLERFLRIDREVPPPPVEAPPVSAQAASAAPVKPLHPEAAPEQAGAPAEPTEAPPSPTPAPPPSLFERNTLVAFYGTPLASGLGVLGLFPPEELAERLKAQAAVYNDLNGDKGVVPALDLIYAVVQDQPTANGLFLAYLPDDRVNEYIALAERHDLQIILDLQIGRSRVVDEVRKIERFLTHPRVHVAIDPEYAVGPNGFPIATPGVISGHDINEAQGYLNELVAQHNLPPKMLVIHQFMDHTIIEGEATQQLPHVDLVLNMDAFGAKPEKEKKYRHFASRPYAEKRSFNVFLKQDEPISSEQEVLQLEPMPDMVIYQ